MTKQELEDRGYQLMQEHESYEEEILDLMHLALSEIEDGSSPTHEYELFMTSVGYLVNDDD